MNYLNINFKSKWLKFVFQEKKSKTSVWDVLHKDGTFLGEIYWYAPWRQYVYAPECNTFYSGGCQDDIKKFMVELRQKELIEVDNFKLSHKFTEMGE